MRRTGAPPGSVARPVPQYADGTGHNVREDLTFQAGTSQPASQQSQQQQQQRQANSSGATTVPPPAPGVAQLQRNMTTTCMLCVAFLVGAAFLIAMTAPGSSDPAFYGRWPGLTAGATARALTWVTRVFQVDEHDDYWDPQPVKKAFVPNSGRDWASICAHRGMLDEATPLAASANVLPASIEALAHDAGVVCADVDVFLTRDGAAVVGHPTVAANRLFRREGDPPIDATRGVALLVNSTAQELFDRDPAHAAVAPLADMRAAMDAVAKRYSTGHHRTANEPEHHRGSVGPCALTHPLTFTFEPKNALLQHDAAAGLARCLPLSTSGGDALSVLARCDALHDALRAGPLVQLLQVARPHLEKSFVLGGGDDTTRTTQHDGGPANASLATQRGADSDEALRPRLIIDLDVYVHEVLLAAPAALRDAAGAQLRGMTPVQRWATPVAQAVLHALAAAAGEVVAADQPAVEGAGPAVSAAAAAPVPTVRRGAFVVPLKDRWLSQVAAVEAAAAEAAAGSAPAASQATDAEGGERSAANATAADSGALSRHPTSARDAAAAAATVRECSVTRALSPWFPAPVPLGSTHTPAAPVLAEDTLPQWVSHLMPSTRYLRMCSPRVVQHGATSTADMRSPHADDHSQRVDATRHDADAGVVDGRTFHCWVVDTEYELFEAVHALRCSHVVTNRPLLMAKHVDV